MNKTCQFFYILSIFYYSYSFAVSGDENLEDTQRAGNITENGSVERMFFTTGSSSGFSEESAGWVDDAEEASAEVLSVLAELLSLSIMKPP